jgi:hypothetical protein
MRAATPPEDVRESEVITVPAEKSWSFSREATLIPGDREALARELQRELARVGCYDGEINGAWTTSTREAMKAFIERVNAALPTNQPDAVLLTLVKGHSGKACGAPCPSGQGRADTGVASQQQSFSVKPTELYPRSRAGRRQRPWRPACRWKDKWASRVRKAKSVPASQRQSRCSTCVAILQ